MTNEFLNYDGVKFVDELEPEQLVEAITTLAKPFATLLSNMERGQCRNETVKLDVRMSLESLRMACRELRRVK